MMRGYKYFVYKFRDRGYITCPTCHRPVTTCPMCHGNLLLEKAASLPDHLVAYDYCFVESKQGEESWPIKDVTAIQEKVMLEQTRLGKEAYLFLELGGGVAPNGRDAFLIPWKAFLDIRERMEASNQGSIRFEPSQRSRMPVGRGILASWRLTWRDGKWSIPEGHSFWKERAK